MYALINFLIFVLVMKKIFSFFLKNFYKKNKTNPDIFKELFLKNNEPYTFKIYIQTYKAHIGTVDWGI